MVTSSPTTVMAAPDARSAPTVAPAPTVTPVSRIVYRMTAPGCTVASPISTESSTTATCMTRTPGPTTEFFTVPYISQPSVM